VSGADIGDASVTHGDGAVFDEPDDGCVPLGQVARRAGFGEGNLVLPAAHGEDLLGADDECWRHCCSWLGSAAIQMGKTKAVSSPLVAMTA